MAVMTSINSGFHSNLEHTLMRDMRQSGIKIETGAKVS